MPSIWVSDKDYKTLIDIKADLEKHRKKPASFSDVVSHLIVKKRMVGGKSRKEVKNTRRVIRAKALTAAISALMLISLISVFQAGTASAQGGITLTVNSLTTKSVILTDGSQTAYGGAPTSFVCSIRGLTGSHVK